MSELGGAAAEGDGGAGEPGRIGDFEGPADDAGDRDPDGVAVSRGAAAGLGPGDGADDASVDASAGGSGSGDASGPTDESGPDSGADGSSGAGTSGVWMRTMAGRDRAERHRVATTLELFFDLCFVGAVSQAAAQLDEFLVQGRYAHGVGSFAVVFFAIWWAWMNFSWFASAYDTDDVLYRVMVLVQIGGGLVLAAGVPKAMVSGDLSIAVAGYVVMRVPMVGQWLRAARDNPPRRGTDLRYAAGIALVQTGWVLRLVYAHGTVGAVWFVILGAADMLVPVWAERKVVTPWHPHHIAERYGLFTIIVLGESVLAATRSRCPAAGRWARSARSPAADCWWCSACGGSTSRSPRTTTRGVPGEQGEGAGGRRVGGGPAAVGPGWWPARGYLVL